MPTHEGLLAELDLHGRDPSAERLAVPMTEDAAGGGAAEPLPNPTALKLDAWGLRRGAEALRPDNPRLLASLLPMDKLEVPEGEDALKHFAGELQGKQPWFPNAALAAADLFGAAFEPDPKLAERCAEPARREFLQQLMETPDYQALHAQTALDEVASELAATHFAEGYARLRQVREEPGPDGKPRTPADGDLEALKAAAQALRGAYKDVGDFHDACRGLGGCGGTDGRMDPRKVAALFRKIRGDQQLKRICELAGRYRLLAQSKQRTKTRTGYDDMVGIEPAGAIDRMLPEELARLADPAFESEALRRLIERQALCRKYEAVEPIGRGPIVVICDSSGSMSGDPICNAKAIALSLAYVARQQKRWVALVEFAGGTEGKRLALPPGRWDEAQLLEWLAHFYGGGTSCDVPLCELPNVYWQEFLAQGMARGKTDIVIITDAIVDVPPEVVTSFNAWKRREQAKVTTIVIQSEPGDLAAVSDTVYRVPGLSVHEEAVQDIVSI